MKQRSALAFASVVFVFVVEFVGFGTAPAFACECKETGDASLEFVHAKAVFVGEVITLDDAKPDASVTFKIERAWKGTKGETAVVLTDNRGKGCGFIFTKGTRYLVYAFGDQNVLRATICSRTAEVATASDDFKKLPPAPQGDDVEREFSNSTAVFAGTVTDREDGDGEMLVTFNVDKIWKGAKSETIVVRTDAHPRGDGLDFKKGQKYLVYADGSTGALHTGIFSRTAVLSDAAADVRRLDEMLRR